MLLASMFLLMATISAAGASTALTARWFWFYEEKIMISLRLIIVNATICATNQLVKTSGSFQILFLFFFG
jgi:hypothetical protein